MSGIGVRIKALREKMGWTQTELAKRSQIDRSLISQWEHGKQDPSAKHLFKLARAFGLPAEALLFDKELVPTGPQGELRLPVMSRVKAGTAAPPVPVEDETVSVTLEEALAADAVIEVKGDSMLPELHPGDHCGVRWQDHAAHDDLIVALIDDFDDITVKRFQSKGDHFLLVPSNKAYPPYSSKRHRIRILGKVIWVKRWYERG
ncbi:MAG: XRE family transcriptional regulator [Armatimonadetes bacterium]|nr:XRE family transcriptional regulator [Armatimonadota bacterium]MDW8122416.1 XRE family transcriptional regulator [Armatimonadota bacterium]